MRRIIAVVLCLVFFVIAGCNTMPFGRDEANVGSTASDRSSVSVSSIIGSGSLNLDGSSDTSSVVSSYGGVSSFDDFADKFEKDNKLNKTENEDGSVTIDINNPTIEPDGGDDDTSPAIPTIDKVTPKPDTDDTSSNSSSNSSKTSSGATSSKTNSSGSTSSDITSSGSTSSKDTTTSSKDTISSSESTPSSRPEASSSSDAASSAPEKTYYTYTTGQTHSKLHYSKRYLYSILTEEQKEWYRAIDTAVTAFKDSAVINANLHENRNYYIYFLYIADNPEHFYLGNTTTVCRKSDNSTELVFCYSDGENYCAYGHTPSRLTPELLDSILQKKSEFDTEVKRIISTIPSAAPDVEKEKLIYDRILLDSHYNLSARWNGVCEPNWNAYGIIVNKYGVCESYSEAFQTLCFAVGINCAGVVGTAGGGHKWNVVELDGEWYMCDITFDDPIGGDPNDAYHYYFNRTSAEMTEDNHNWDDCEWTVPECKGTKYSYRNYFVQ